MPAVKPAVNIDKTLVDACQPSERQYLKWDAKISGFGLLVLPSGAKSYVYQYRIGGRSGRLRRWTIGKHGALTPAKAREAAEDLKAKVRAGIDPIDAERESNAEKKRVQAAKVEHERSLRELAFAAYAERFLSLGVKPATRQRTREGYASTLRNHVTPVLRDKPLPEIARRDIVRVMDRAPIGQPAVRRITFAVMRMLFNWAKGRGDITRSPLEGMDAPPLVASRDRVLTDEELALALRAAGNMDAPFGPLYQMLFATGQRREEVAGMDWAELDRASAIWTLPGRRSKNGEANVVPLNRFAMAALARIAGPDALEWPRRGLVFSSTGQSSVSGYSRAKSRLDALMGQIAVKEASDAGIDPGDVSVAPWRLHDARRTLATALQRLGVRFEVTEAVLNHRSGASRSGVAAVYQRHGWGPEKRAALDAWADHCERLLNPCDAAGNVVPLRANAPA